MASLPHAKILPAGAEFEDIKRALEAVSDRLNSHELLELADCLHERIRWRRRSDAEQGRSFNA